MGHMFEIKRGDLEPLAGWLEDHDGRPLPLAQATSLLFHMRASGAAVPIIASGVATITDATTAAAAYRWQTGETGTVGYFEGEFEVLWADGGRRRVPNRGYIPIVVTERI